MRSKRGECCPFTFKDQRGERWTFYETSRAKALVLARSWGRKRGLTFGPKKEVQ